MSIDWGSVPDWLAGCGAVAALLWARKAAKAATEANKRQFEQLRQIEEDKRRSQAECIAAWAEWKRDTDSAHRVVRIVNSSKVPVYFVAVYVIDVDNDSLVDLREPTVLPPTSTPRTLRIRGAMPVNDERRLPDVGILFADASNRVWHRDPQGRLTEQSDESYEVLHQQFVSKLQFERDISSQYDGSLGA